MDNLELDLIRYLQEQKSDDEFSRAAHGVLSVVEQIKLMRGVNKTEAMFKNYISGFFEKEVNVYCEISISDDPDGFLFFAKCFVEPSDLSSDADVEKIDNVLGEALTMSLNTNVSKIYEQDVEIAFNFSSKKFSLDPLKDKIISEKVKNLILFNRVSLDVADTLPSVQKTKNKI